jgi:hypothetical protein
MDSATNLIYRAAGSPAMQTRTDGRCRTCGVLGSGLPFTGWVRDTFTDWDKIGSGEIICQACQFCFTDQNEALAKKLDKPAPQRMRNYSHFVRRGEWVPLSKADKPRMRELLLSPLDLAVIALSGQKHIIFRGKPGWWQFEERSLRAFPGPLGQALAIVEDLYDGGFNKSEIETGRYSQKRILDFGLDHWRRAEAFIRPMRGSARLALAIFLASRSDSQEES